MAEPKQEVNAEAQATAKAGVDLQKENEELRKQLAEAQATAKAGVNEKAVRSAYDKGANYYDLATKFFGFNSDEAVAKVRQIIEG